MKHEKWEFTIYHLGLDPRISWSNEHPKQDWLKMLPDEVSSDCRLNIQFHFHK